MDADRFDTLLRSLAQTPSRRGALRVLAGSVLAGLVTVDGDNSDAHNPLKKCKKKSGKAKKKCLTKAKAHNATHATASCTRNCAGKTCGADGCGGGCGVACTGGRTCQNGTCRCPGGTELCNDTCVAPCGPGTQRTSSTCTCCKTQASPCSAPGPDSSCCSGVCRGSCNGGFFTPCESTSQCGLDGGICVPTFCV
jgi:hypothetical protein